jgi:hypothetical protein
MRALALIDGASFGPDALKAISRAFDQAWSEVATYFDGDAVVRDGARVALANAILSVASDDSRDVEVLKKAGLQAMAQNYASMPIAKPKELRRS